jgi:pyruvate/2-oxoglutarate dehydrogenase complex dihydrolipoamide dehydrogenase (E3) component
METYSYLPSEEKAIEDAEKALNRSGFILDDPEVRSALGKYADKSKTVLDPDAIELLKKDFEDTVKEIAVAMKSEATVEEIADTVHPHPSVSEIIMEAAHDVEKLSVHKM